jgi:hypothetical protein
MRVMPIACPGRIRMSSDYKGRIAHYRRLRPAQHDIGAATVVCYDADRSHEEPLTGPEKAAIAWKALKG